MSTLIRVYAISMLLACPTIWPQASHRAITDRGPWGDYEAFPGACKLQNGDLYVVFYAGRGHVTEPCPELPKGGTVYAVRSSDSGRTWSEPILVIDTPLDDRDPHVTQLRDGRLVCNFFTSRYYTEDGKRKREADVLLVWSEDNGRTWTREPQRVPTPYRDKAGIGRRVFVSSEIRQLKGDHVILPIYHQEIPGHYVTAIVHSFDGGRTWPKVCEVDAETSIAFSYGFCEATVARITDGRLICIMRPGMHQSYSFDEGLMWSKATKLPHRGDAPSAILTRSGHLVVAHRHPGTSVSISADNGQTWTRPWLLDRVGGAYPGLVELDDGSIFCAYYEEGKASDIRMAIFRIAPGIDVADLEEKWPPPLPPGRKLDLAALYEKKAIRVDTDLTLPSERFRGGGVASAFDGDTSYRQAAWKATQKQPAYYTIELDQAYRVTGVGLCLKTSQPGHEFKETADVLLSIDGDAWGEPVLSLKNAAMPRLRHFTFDEPKAATFVKVVIHRADGWPSLNEIEVFVED